MLAKAMCFSARTVVADCTSFRIFLLIGKFIFNCGEHVKCMLPRLLDRVEIPRSTQIK